MYNFITNTREASTLIHVHKIFVHSKLLWVIVYLDMSVEYQFIDVWKAQQQLTQQWHYLWHTCVLTVKMHYILKLNLMKNRSKLWSFWATSVNIIIISCKNLCKQDKIAPIFFLMTKSNEKKMRRMWSRLKKIIKQIKKLTLKQELECGTNDFFINFEGLISNSNNILFLFLNFYYN